MRISIVGAGNVGRSIATELIGNGHDIVLFEISPTQFQPQRVPDADWILADACELERLQEAHLERCDVVVAATGDDKANLVVSLLAKTEFGIPRVVARVNRAENEWLFTEQWGVDVAVSKPRLLAALVEEAVSIGRLVRLMSFQQSQANLVEITVPHESPVAGRTVGDIAFPQDAVLVAILRGKRVIAPTPEDTIEISDELVLVCAEAAEEPMREVLLGDTSNGPNSETAKR